MRTLAALGISVLLVAAGCGGSSERAAPPSTAGLTDLRSVDQLRTLFVARAGEPRLILLISPT